MSGDMDITEVLLGDIEKAIRENTEALVNIQSEIARLGLQGRDVRVDFEQTGHRGNIAKERDRQIAEYLEPHCVEMYLGRLIEVQWDKQSDEFIARTAEWPHLSFMHHDFRAAVDGFRGVIDDAIAVTEESVKVIKSPMGLQLECAHCGRTSTIRDEYIKVCDMTIAEIIEMKIRG